MNFHKRLRQLRRERDLTQEELGKCLGGIRQSTVAGWETDRETDYETLKKIAALFKVTTDYLLGASDFRTWQIWKEHPSNIDLEDFVKNQSNIQLMGEPLDKDTKDDVLLFLQTAHNFIKRKEQK